MSNVYFYKFKNEKDKNEIKARSRELLEKIVDAENISLNGEIPLKVHFGENKNQTYIQSGNFEGIIEYLNEKNVKTSYIETTVMYGGKRYKKDLHLKTAEEHGFNQIPVIIADGDIGGDFYEVKIPGRHFKKCKLGKEFNRFKQVIVLSHFKGHILAGFGGAIKNLAMGFASKGGKLAQHMGIKPRIKKRKCKRCNLCKTRCAVNAITIDDKPFINHEVCIGCGACVSICPHKAVSIFSLKSILKFLGIGNPFREKVVEYAHAAHKGRENIYLNFIMNVTKGCDCEPRKMKPVVDDIGILASIDPVAIDKAGYDLVKQNGKKFRGHKTFNYAEEMGMGQKEYTLIEI